MSYMKHALEEIHHWNSTFKDVQGRPGYYEASCNGWKFIVTATDLDNHDIGVSIWSPTERQLRCSAGQYLPVDWLSAKLEDSNLGRVYIYSKMIADLIDGTHQELAA